MARADIGDEVDRWAGSPTGEWSRRGGMDAPPSARARSPSPERWPSPPLLLGTDSVGSVDPTGLFSRRSRREAFRLLDAAYEAGCRALDMARSYMGGGTERVVGEWLRGSGVRDELFLVSKAGHPSLLRRTRLDTGSLEGDVRATLAALGIARLDLVLLHRDDPALDLPRVARDLARMQDRGWARRTGVSNWTLDRILALEAATERSVVAASSPQLSLAPWRSAPWSGCVTLSGPGRASERARYAELGLPVLAYCPLGRGFLTESRSPARSRHFEEDANRARRGRCRDLAERRDVTPAQIAIAYLANLPFPTFPVVGTHNPDHLRANLGALQIALSPEEMRWLEHGGSAGKA